MYFARVECYYFTRDGQGNMTHRKTLHSFRVSGETIETCQDIARETVDDLKKDNERLWKCIDHVELIFRVPL